MGVPVFQFETPPLPVPLGSSLYVYILVRPRAIRFKAVQTEGATLACPGHKAHQTYLTFIISVKTVQIQEYIDFGPLLAKRCLIGFEFGRAKCQRRGGPRFGMTSIANARTDRSTKAIWS